MIEKFSFKAKKLEVSAIIEVGQARTLHKISTTHKIPICEITNNKIIVSGQERTLEEGKKHFVAIVQGTAYTYIQ